MKRICSFLAVLTIVCSETLTSRACTSFAVYSDNIIYAMNFDFPETEAAVKIYDVNDRNSIFTISFESFGMYGNTPIINDKGLFSACQNQYPREIYTYTPEDGVESVSEFAWNVPIAMNTVSEARNALYDKTLSHVYDSYHVLFADTSGDAMVLELIDDEIVKTDIKNDFIVMTNFANARLEKEDYRDIIETGSDRYAIAYEYISEHFSDFNVERAFDVLEKTCQDIPYATQYSVVFEPVSRLAYISIKGDFEKIWKVSIDDRTLQTYKGFNIPVTYSIDEDGIPLSELIEYGTNDANSDDVKTEDTGVEAEDAQTEEGKPDDTSVTDEKVDTPQGITPFFILIQAFVFAIVLGAFFLYKRLKKGIK